MRSTGVRKQTFNFPCCKLGSSIPQYPYFLGIGVWGTALSVSIVLHRLMLKLEMSDDDSAHSDVWQYSAFDLHRLQ